MFTKHFSPAFACLFLFALPAWAGKPVNEIRAAAEKEADALVHGDYDTVAIFTYPRIVELSGGRPGLVKLLSSGFADMKTKGISLASTVIGEPGPLVRSGAKLYSVVPAIVVIKAPGTKITQPSYLLAISSDSGATWTFIDGAGINPATISQVIPDLPSDLKLPAHVAPTKESE